MESQVTARSGLISMTIRKILTLQPGDIVDLHYNPDQPLTVLVPKTNRFFLPSPGKETAKGLSRHRPLQQQIRRHPWQRLAVWTEIQHPQSRGDCGIVKGAPVRRAHPHQPEQQERGLGIPL